MQKWKRIALLLLVALAATGVWYFKNSRRAPGVYLELSRVPSLLPMDKVWRYDFVLPRELTENEFVDLEVRRWTQAHKGDGTGHVAGTREEQPDATLRSGGAGGKGLSGHVALQLLDLRDFDEDKYEAHSLRCAGGMSKEGQLTSLRRDDNFFLGHLYTWSVDGNQSWHRDQAKLLSFQSTDKISDFAYEAVLVIKQRRR